MIEYENLAKLNAPFFAEFEKTFKQTMERGWYILGEQVKTFETEFAHYVGSQHCVGLASGLDAITLGIIAMDLPRKSEIIVPSNTYIATILGILQAGHTPVLVEPDVETYNIDPKKIEEKVTSKTKALCIVHLYGKCCEMDPILDICQRHGLQLLEDAAQAHGAKYKGKMAGSFGDVGAFSFYPTKNLGALGDAGALTTSRKDIEERVRTLRNYGSKIKYHNEMIGFNSRLDEIQAAFLRVKLKSLDAINDHKRKLASLYLKGLGKHVILPQVHSDFHDVYHIFNVRHPQRDHLRNYLSENGVKTEVHYPVSPVRQEAMKGILDHVRCPIADDIHATTVSLPISYFHTEEDVRKVIDVMNSFK